MQGLIYTFIALGAAGIAGAAYFGLTFSPIEAVVTGLVFACIAVVLQERSLRRRAESRLERAIEELSRLLSTDAQAGAVLSQRINALANTDAGTRLEAIEADISVLGTVIRQVAEAVAEIESSARPAPAEPPPPPEPAPVDEDSFPEPVVTGAELQRAIAENRLVCHVEPLLMLPQRRPHGYDLVPRLLLEDGDVAEASEFMPRRGVSATAQRIEALLLEEAIVIVRRARTADQPIRLFLPLSRATTSDLHAVAQLFATLDANRAIADELIFSVAFSDWRAMPPQEKSVLTQIGQRGVSFSLVDALSLRLDFSELESVGFTSIRVDAGRFLRNPLDFTDFHTGDISPYARRYHVDLVATGIVDEQQLLSFLEDDIVLVQGPHITSAGPVGTDLLVERPVPPVAPYRAPPP